MRGECGNAEMVKRWKRGNGANKVDKSGCGREDDIVKRREEREMKMGDGVEIKAESGGKKVEETYAGRRMRRKE